MFFCNQFEILDPISGDVPTQQFSYMAEIAYRARTLLGCKIGSYREEECRKRILSIARKINDVIEAYFADALEMKLIELRSERTSNNEKFEVFFEKNDESDADGPWLFKTEMIEELEIPTATNTSEVDALKAVIEERDSHFFLPEGSPDLDVEEYPEGKDYELFAVLSLWLLADALRFLNKTDIGKSVAGGFALKAMDAVCYAEHLREAEWLLSYAEKKNDAKLKEAIEIYKKNHTDAIKYWLNEKKGREVLKKTERSRQMNQTRHEKTYEAKAMAIAEWVKDTTKYRSAEKAGNAIAAWLESQKILNPALGEPYEPRTVTGWIRDHAKKIEVKFR